MMANNRNEAKSTIESNYDPTSDLRAFDDTKAGVKGLVDAGINKSPRIFYQPQDNFDMTLVAGDVQYIFPITDLEGVDENSIQVQRKKIVERVQNALETWGFFQVIKHRIPFSILEEMKDGVEHRELANRVGPRVSVASFFTTGVLPCLRLYGSIEELLSEKNHLQSTKKQQLEITPPTPGKRPPSALLHFWL